MNELMSFEQFINKIDEEQKIFEAQIIDYNDEIISIEECGELEMVDISVTGNQLFYCQDILIHNCATNNIDADNSTISDSYGSLMTADFLMFILQTEDMKKTGDVVFKITKNRFSGMTESFPMKVNYVYMRFEDPAVLQSFTGDMNQVAFMEQFEINKKATDEQLREARHADVEIAKKFDEVHKVFESTDKIEIPAIPLEEVKSMDDLLKDLF
mgnify:FL=1